MRKDKGPYSSIREITGFLPKDIRLYRLALLHSSAREQDAEGHPLNNERLEYLGDAVLDTIVAALLYRRYPYQDEGFLTDLRSKIVSREMLNQVARGLGLNNMVVCSHCTFYHNNYMYGNVFEALLGALYLDQGYDACYTFVSQRIIDRYINIEQMRNHETNFKSKLITWAQRRQFTLEFKVVECDPDAVGNYLFRTSILLEGREIGQGTGFSKKVSHQHAAETALNNLKSDTEIKAYVKLLKKQPKEEPQTEKEPSAVSL